MPPVYITCSRLPVRFALFDYAINAHTIDVRAEFFRQGLMFGCCYEDLTNVRTARQCVLQFGLKLRSGYGAPSISLEYNSFRCLHALDGWNRERERERLRP